MIVTGKNSWMGWQEKGDQVVFNHVANIAPTLESAKQLREFSDNGWTHDRSLRQIGCIDAHTFHKLMTERPEIAKDPDKLRDWLMSSEGEEFRTVKKIDTGRSGHCVVK